MWSFLFFIGLIVLTFIISRNNYRKRSITLMDNLQSFSEHLKVSYSSLPISHQQNFKNSLTEKEKSYFEALLTDSIKYKPSVWSIQEHMMKQEGLMIDLKKIQKTVSVK